MKMSSTTITTSTKPLDLSTKLMNKIDENKKLNKDKKLTRNKQAYYLDSDNVRCLIDFDKSLILILDGKHMYDDNQEQYNCIPFALPIYLEEFITGDTLCNIFNCSKIYITREKKVKNIKLKIKKEITSHAQSNELSITVTLLLW